MNRPVVMDDDIARFAGHGDNVKVVLMSFDVKGLSPLDARSKRNIFASNEIPSMKRFGPPVRAAHVAHGATVVGHDIWRDPDRQDLIAAEPPIGLVGVKRRVFLTPGLFDEHLIVIEPREM